MDRVTTLGAAVDLVPDGSSLYVGGAVLRRKPMAFLRALADAGRRDLDVISFAGSVDVDLLVAAGCARSISSAYVGLGSAGPAPAFRRAVEAGDVDDREYSEWTMLAGLRAASMGIPFIPTRAAAGSEVLDHLGLLRTDDPYGSGTYLAVPPLRPDVAVLHAWRATAAGFVQLADLPEHLWDVDVVAARAASTTVVTVEELVDEDAVAAEPHLTALLPVDVDAVVVAPGGSWPTAAPPRHEEDHEAVAGYAASGDLAVLAGARP